MANNFFTNIQYSKLAWDTVKYEQLNGTRKSKIEEENLDDGLSKKELANMDADGDGKVTEKEFKQAYGSGYSTMWNTYLTAFNKNMSGNNDTAYKNFQQKTEAQKVQKHINFAKKLGTFDEYGKMTFEGLRDFLSGYNLGSYAENVFDFLTNSVEDEYVSIKEFAAFFGLCDYANIDEDDEYSYDGKALQGAAKYTYNFVLETIDGKIGQEDIKYVVNILSKGMDNDFKNSEERMMFQKYKQVFSEFKNNLDIYAKEELSASKNVKYESTGADFSIFTGKLSDTDKAAKFLEQANEYIQKEHNNKGKMDFEYFQYLLKDTLNIVINDDNQVYNLFKQLTSVTDSNSVDPKKLAGFLALANHCNSTVERTDVFKWDKLNGKIQQSDLQKAAEGLISNVDEFKETLSTFSSIIGRINDITSSKNVNNENSNKTTNSLNTLEYKSKLDESKETRTDYIRTQRKNINFYKTQMNSLVEKYNNIKSEISSAINYETLYQLLVNFENLNGVIDNANYTSATLEGYYNAYEQAVAAGDTMNDLQVVINKQEREMRNAQSVMDQQNAIMAEEEEDSDNYKKANEQHSEALKAYEAAEQLSKDTQANYKTAEALYNTKNEKEETLKSKIKEFVQQYVNTIIPNKIKEIKTAYQAEIDKIENNLYIGDDNNNATLDYSKDVLISNFKYKLVKTKKFIAEDGSFKEIKTETALNEEVRNLENNNELKTLITNLKTLYTNCSAENLTLNKTLIDDTLALAKKYPQVASDIKHLVDEQIDYVNKKITKELNNVRDNLKTELNNETNTQKQIELIQSINENNERLSELQKQIENFKKQLYA